MEPTMKNHLSEAAIQKLLGHSKNISSTWPLFLYLLSNINSSGNLKTTYSELSKILSYPEPTIKSWRNKLVNMKLINSYPAKYSMVFELSQEWKELMNSNGKLNKPKVEGNSNNGLFPIIIDLAQRLTALELNLSRKPSE